MSKLNTVRILFRCHVRAGSSVTHYPVMGLERECNLAVRSNEEYYVIEFEQGGGFVEKGEVHWITFIGDVSIPTSSYGQLRPTACEFQVSPCIISALIFSVYMCSASCLFILGRTWVKLVRRSFFASTPSTALNRHVFVLQQFVSRGACFREYISQEICVSYLCSL